MASIHKRSRGPLALRAAKPARTEALIALFLAGVAGVCGLAGYPTFAFLPGVWAAGLAGDYLVSLRRCEIVIANAELRTRNRLGLKDLRPIEGMLTVEWHAGYAWPISFRRWWTATLRSHHGQFQPRFDTIVFNYEDMWDNVKISGRGFTPADVPGLADHVGVHFIDFSSTTGNPERDHDRLQPDPTAREDAGPTRVTAPPKPLTTLHRPTVV